MSQPSAGDETQIRRAGAADAPAIHALTQSAYAKWVPVIGRRPLPMATDYDQAVREHRIDLLFTSDQLVALIELVDRGDDLLIANLAVAPAVQRRGHGQRLLAHAEALAVELGRPQLRLYTNKQFSGTVELYIRTGFAIEREEPFKGGIKVHMHKPLQLDRPGLSG